LYELIFCRLALKRAFDEEVATGIPSETWASRHKLASTNTNLGPVSNKMNSSTLVKTTFVHSNFESPEMG
jgi:hypothetical protein